MAAIQALTKTDMKNIWRDPLMRFVLSYPLILGLIMRWLVPFVAEGIADLHDIYQYYPLINGLFGFVMTPVLMGLAIGLLLLDEKDDRTLVALRVTPMTMTQYLGYRLVVPVLVSFVASFVVLGLMGISTVPLISLVPLAVLGALTSPLYTLLLASIAGNKVQGLALMKGLSIFIIAPVIAWWIPVPWQWGIGVFPTYWPMKAYWILELGGSVWWLYMDGVVVLAVYLYLLVRRFEMVMIKLAA